MKVSEEKIDAHKTVLEIEVPQAEVAKAFDRAYQKLAAKVNIPGFRKGKAPRKVLEMRLGKETLMDEALDILVSGSYPKALKERNIEPVSRPEIDVAEFEQDKPLVYKATVVPKPEVVLGEYKGLKVEKNMAEVTAKDIDKQLDNLRNRHARMVVAGNAAKLKKGDFAMIDFEGFIDGQPFKGGDAKGYPLEVGSGSFIPGFEDQLIGARAGEEREITVTFPQDYFAAEMAGKEAVFKVKVHDIKRKELPALDDDFVKEVGEFDTLEELKADIENKLKQTAADQAERDFRTSAIKTAVENAQIDIPEIMVEEELDSILREMDVNLQNRGLSLEKYAQMSKTDIGELREKYRDQARYSVKTDLVLDAVAKAENLEVKPEDFEAEVAAMAAGYQAPVEEVRKIIMEQGRVGALASRIVRKKAAQFIVDGVAAE